MELNKLKAVIPYKWRKGPSGTQLAYIDARDVQDRLDDVCGPENWQSDFKLIDGKLFGGIGIQINNDIGYGIWVWKWDCGVESNIEEEKGQVSDAFKRAGVQWGIGRFLYDIKPTTGANEHVVKQETVKTINTPIRTFLKEGQIARDSKGYTACVICGKSVGKQVEVYSLEHFNKILCMDCQKKQ